MGAGLRERTHAQRDLIAQLQAIAACSYITSFPVDTELSERVM